MESQQDYLKRRFDYESWRGKDAADGGMLIGGLRLTGDELPGWQPHRIQRGELENLPPYIHSIWRRVDGGDEVLLRLDIYECASAAAAREFLLRLLGELQSPEIARQEQNTVGDVAFVYPQETMILFTRLNLVLQLRNAGREVVQVTGLARQLDQTLTGRIPR
jgi:hypothetical protein